MKNYKKSENYNAVVLRFNSSLLYKVSALLFFFLAVKTIGSGQNLVINGDFESYNACPDTSNQMSRAMGWRDLLGTPDYCNTCGYDNNMATEPYEGIGFAKLFVVNGHRFRPLLIQTYHEYIQGQLVDELKAGTSYYFSLQFRRHHGSGVGNNLGVLFSQEELIETDTSYIRGAPHILQDSQIWESKWMPFEGCYTASGGEKFLNIGGFFDGIDVKIDTIDEQTSSISYLVFIDQIEVYEILLDTNTDTIICSNSLLNLNNFKNNIPFEIREEGKIIEDSIVQVESQIRTFEYFTPNCDNISYTLNVIPEDCVAAFVYTPNAFSPNHDNKNDIWKPHFSNDNIAQKELHIFDRWGKEIYVQSGDNISWDGSDSKGKMLNPGVYVFLIKYTDTSNSENIIKIISGDITLVK